MLYRIINFVIFYYLYHNLNILNYISVKIIFIFAYLAITYLSFYLFKWINKEDWKSLLALADIKSMNRYIKDEIRRK